MYSVRDDIKVIKYRKRNRLICGTNERCEGLGAMPLQCRNMVRFKPFPALVRSVAVVMGKTLGCACFALKYRFGSFHFQPFYFRIMLPSFFSRKYHFGISRFQPFYSRNRTLHHNSDFYRAVQARPSKRTKPSGTNADIALLSFLKTAKNSHFIVQNDGGF